MTVSFTDSAFQNAMQSLWRRRHGLNAGYWVTLNPEIEAQRRKLYEDQEAIAEAINALYAVERCAEVVANLQEHLREIVVTLDALPETQTAFCEGPNPDVLQMEMSRMLHPLIDAMSGSGA